MRWVIVVLACVCMPMPAVASEACAPFVSFVFGLFAHYGEEVAERRVIDPHTLLLVFVAPKGKSWTAARVDSKPPHITCFAGIGENWAATKRDWAGRDL